MTRMDSVRLPTEACAANFEEVKKLEDPYKMSEKA
jgi:hypothetical protein